MMTELSLNILDIAENSTRAGALLVQITVDIQPAADTLTIRIEDDGCGMNKEQIARVTDPFYTTRTTRKVGLGVPFFKQAAESTGGSFSIDSTPGVGTCVCAVFGYTHIDRMPLGDMVSTIHTLVLMHTDCEFCYTYRVGEREFVLDTREFKRILGGIPLDTPEVSSYIKEFLSENQNEINQGIEII